MKKHFLFIITAFFLTTAAIKTNAQSAKDKIMATVAAFPYQHKEDADAALTTMGTWSKAQWSTLVKLLNDDSLKVKATYALGAYTNAAAQDVGKKSQWSALLKSFLSASKSEYAKIFLQSQLNLLADKAAIEAANNSLPRLPENKMVTAPALNSEQTLLLLEDRMAAAKNPVEKRNILSQAAHIPGFSSFMLVSKALNDADIAGDAALALARLVLADETIKGAAVRTALEKALPLIKGDDSAVLVTKLQPVLRKMPYDYGFVSLFNGVDLTGWKALVENPIARSKMTEEQ